MQPLYITIGTAVACIGAALIGVGAILAAQTKGVVGTYMGFVCDPKQRDTRCRLLYETADGDIIARDDPDHKGPGLTRRTIATLSEADPDVWSPAYSDRKRAFILLLVSGGVAAVAGVALVYAGATGKR